MNQLTAIYLKELKEVLRDRRTIVFMILLPVLVLPLLFNGLIGFIQRQEKKSREEVLKLAIVNSENIADLQSLFVEHSGFKVVEEPLRAAELKTAIKRGAIDFGLVFPEDAAELLTSKFQLEIGLYYDNASPTSKVIPRARKVLSSYSETLQKKRLKELGLESSLKREALIKPAQFQIFGVADRRETLGERIGGLLPYMFIIFCFTGAMYPALDLGVGEKERGTLETLLLTPVPRSTLVVGKFSVIFTTGITAALLCLTSTGLWIAIKGKGISGELGDIIASVSVLDLLLIGFMLVPLAALFACILLCISIYAKGFKEAQSYVAPLTFFVIVPAMIATLPGIELTWTWAMVPVTNIALAIKELAKGTIDYTLLVLIFGSTAFCAVLGLLFCVKWFQREDVLFRS